MNIAVLGTGMVGQTIGTALIRAGHTVCMGSRSAANPKAVQWAQEAGAGARNDTFAGAVRDAEVVFNCTAGQGSLAALQQAGAAALAGKLLIDVANPLDFSQGMPPRLSVCNTDSLGEQIQRAFPETRVVKALNTMNCLIMVDPARVPGTHNVFLSGNDAAAKETAARLLEQAFGWDPQQIIDLGDISTARGTEMLLPVWIRLWGALGTGDFNFHIAGAPVRQRPAAATNNADPVPVV